MRTTAAHFTVDGVHIDGAREATVTIEPAGQVLIFKVRPKGKHKSYELRLSDVAEMAAWRAAKMEANR